MKKINRVLREILYRFYEQNESFMSQKSLAQACELSMDTVNRVVTKLNQFHTIKKKPLGFRVVDPKKVLTYWACTRNLARDISYSTYSSDSVVKIEDKMPHGAVFTAFSGYRRRFGKTPTHYEQVFVYADPAEVRRRFPESPAERKNVFVMRPDPHLAQTNKDGAAPIAQIYVDLWQLGGDPADRFLLELETKLKAKPIEALKALAQKSP
ncbi:MAG: hypothetical protein ACETWO_04095 [Candidatus Hadarchaeaceae archaeon]